MVEENSYYAFGLQHKGDCPAPTGLGNAHAEQYKYQGQERQEELGLGWDSFRHRNYDYAIGRFFGVDPIAEDFVDISTYQFAHNSPVWKVELEGLEGVPFQNLMTIDAAVNPNGVSAHIIGVAQGLGNVVKGVVNAVSNPTQTLKAMGNTALAGAIPGIPHSTKQKILNKVDSNLGTSSAKANQALATSLKNGVNKLINGNGQERGEVLGEIAGAVIGTKGMNAAVKV